MMLEEVPLNWWGQTWFGEEVKMSLDILDQAKPALRKMIRRDKNHPCVIIWSMCNECRTDTEIGITVMRELLRLAKSLDPTRLVTFVSNGNPMDHLGYDEADIVCFNKYYGTLEGSLCDNISQIDSLGFQPFVKELSLVRNSFINKPYLSQNSELRELKIFMAMLHIRKNFRLPILRGSGKESGVFPEYQEVFSGAGQTIITGSI